MSHEELEKRRRFSPGSLLVRVDGIDRCTLLQGQTAIDLLLEKDAGLIEIVGTTMEGDPVVMACCVLTYDEPKEELWEVDLPDLGTLTCQLQYDENDCASARFVVTPTSVLGKPPLVKMFVITDSGKSSSFALKLWEESVVIETRSGWLWTTQKELNRQKNDYRSRQRAAALLQKLIDYVAGSRKKARLVQHDNYAARALTWLCGGTAALLGTPGTAAIHRDRSIAEEGLGWFLKIASIGAAAFATLWSGRYFGRIIRLHQKPKLDLEILTRVAALYNFDRSDTAAPRVVLVLCTRQIDCKTPIAIARSLELLAEGILKAESGLSLLRHGTEKELEQVFYQFGGQGEVPLLARSLVKSRPIDNLAQILNEFERIVPESETWDFLRARIGSLTIKEQR